MKINGLGIEDAAIEVNPHLSDATEFLVDGKHQLHTLRFC